MTKKDFNLSKLKVASFITAGRDAIHLKGGIDSGLSCPKELCNTDPIECWEATLHTCTD